MSSENGVSDVLASISRLETRARHMAVGTGTTRVARNAKSVYDASCRVLAGVQSSTDPTSSSDAFLANIMGFDIAEQQRVLHHMSSNQAQFSQSQEETEGPTTSTQTTVDLEAFLARRRMEALERTVKEVHYMFDQEQQLVNDAYVTEAIDERTNEIADMLGLSSLRLLEVQRPPVELTSTQSLSLAAEEKVRAFADVIEGAPTPAWPDLLTNVAIEHAGGDLDDPTAVLWSTAQGIISYRADNPGGDPSPVLAVACSRAVLEDKYLMHIFATVLQADAGHFEELSRMHPSKMRGYIAQFCPDKRQDNMWYHVYVALRAGRYETAHLTALENGNQSLATIIKQVSSLPVIHRNSSRANADIAALWNDEQTRDDAYRCAVLVVLGGTSLGATNEAAVQLLDTLCGRVAETLEDVLWLRLAVVRSVGDSDEGNIHNLVELQRRVLEDKPHILAMVGGDPVKYATTMLHCLLPSTAVRVLLDNPPTTVDGTHIGLMFDAFNQITFTVMEASVDVPTLLRRHAQLLLKVPTRDGRPSPARAIFDYFSKAERGKSFVSLCTSDQMVSRLFGRIDDRAGREGELLRSVPSVDLLDAMELIARELINTNNILAVHVLIVLDRCSCARKEYTRGAAALHSAIRAITPKISNAIHSVRQRRDPQLLHVVNCLHEDVASSRHDLPNDDVDTFRTLRALLTVHVASIQGDDETAFRVVSAIPFIPHDPTHVSDVLQRYSDLLRSDDVQTTLDVSCRLLMNLFVSRFNHTQSYESRNELRRRGQALLLWTVRWESPPSADLLDYLTAEQEKLMC